MYYFCPDIAQAVADRLADFIKSQKK